MKGKGRVPGRHHETRGLRRGVVSCLLGGYVSIPRSLTLYGLSSREMVIRVQK